MGTYSSSIAGLATNTTYYVRAYATNSQGTGYGDEQSFTTLTSGETVTDYDGNVYNTVQIGDQIWMAENLKVTHYADGTAIPLVEDASAWDAQETNDKAYCWYDNSTFNRDTYGSLYTWSAAMNGASSSFSNPSGVQGVCPDGWHLPSKKEWNELGDFVGGLEIAGGKLKEAGYAHWFQPNTGATNSSGFTALPGGRRNATGPYFERGRIARFWSTTEVDLQTVYHFGISHDEALAGLGYYGPPGNKEYGISIRCVNGDTETDTVTVTDMLLIANYPLNSHNRDVTDTNLPMTLINAPFKNGGVYSNGLYKTPDASQIVTPYRLSGFDINSFIISADFMLLDDPNSSSSPFPIWVGGTRHRWVGFCYSNVKGKHLAAILTNSSDYTFLDTELKENQWYNAKISYDGQTVRAFLDEELIGITEVSELNHIYDYNIGSTHYGKGSTFNGYLKNLKVYSIAVDNSR